MPRIFWGIKKKFLYSHYDYICMTELAFRLLSVPRRLNILRRTCVFPSWFLVPLVFLGTYLCVVDRNQFQRNSFRKFSNTWLNNDWWRQSHNLLFYLRRERWWYIETNFTISCFYLSLLFPGLTKSCSKLRYFFFWTLMPNRRPVFLINTSNNVTQTELVNACYVLIMTSAVFRARRHW